MAKVIISNGFLPVSVAVDRLAQGMWGGLPRTAPVRDVKRAYGQHGREISVGFGPWKEEAGKLLRGAAVEGKFPVYIFAGLQPSIEKLGSDPVLLPRDVLGRMIPARGTLPDHIIRPSMKIAGGDAKILKIFETGILLVGEEEFNNWYRSERAKSKWRSQDSSLKRRKGRPSKRPDTLRNAVTAALYERKMSIAELRHHLIASGLPEVPSRDTLRRFLDDLHRETGEPNLRRRKRVRRKPTAFTPLAQNSSLVSKKYFYSEIQ